MFDLNFYINLFTKQLNLDKNYFSLKFLYLTFKISNSYEQLM